MTASDHLPILDIQKKLFLEGSRTYYNATKFFPRYVRERVTILYAFVRRADNIVDSLQQDAEAFDRFYLEYKKLRQLALAGTFDYEGTDPVIAAFVHLSVLCNFDPSWTEAFFHSMRLDLTKREYNTLEETLEYMYGSAEVIGLLMARIMELPDEALNGARMLGRAMQYINFLRDIEEDNTLGRRYIPLDAVPFCNLLETETRKYPRDFEKFMRRELMRFLEWQAEAENAFGYLQRNCRMAIYTASDMYLWTAEQLYDNPWLVYKGSVKPGKTRIILRGLANLFPASGSRKVRYHSG